MSGSGLGGLETIFQCIFTFSRPSFSRVFYLFWGPSDPSHCFARSTWQGGLGRWWCPVTFEMLKIDFFRFSPFISC